MGLGKWDRLKVRLLSNGVVVTPSARAELLNRWGAIGAHDYVTTDGITVILPGERYVNAPFDEWYCDEPAGVIEWADDGFVLITHEEQVDVSVVPPPSYLFGPGGPPPGIMTHADRIRISPVSGCAFACTFCDMPQVPYMLHSAETLLTGMRVALHDELLAPRHVLISGGTPRPDDQAALHDIYERLIAASELPVDVMLAPADTGIIDRLARGGVHGVSVNLEIYDEGTCERLAPNKSRIGRDAYRRFISEAIESLGSDGRVRSLLIVGLEPLESTLEGVDFLAAQGCSPVLSPFRPAAGTALSGLRPPAPDLLESVYVQARAIAHSYGVSLGPSCAPCQHNVVAFPSDAKDS